MGIKLGEKQLQYMTLFENISGAPLMDCILPDKDDRVVFLVKKENMSMAIGKGGFNVKKARGMIGREVEIVEYCEDPAEFIRKIVAPARVKEIRIVEGKDKKTAYLKIHAEDKGLAIGRGGSNIEKVRTLASRHHSIDDVLVV
jgi:N utilization substance protein A